MLLELLGLLSELSVPFDATKVTPTRCAVNSERFMEAPNNLTIQSEGQVAPGRVIRLRANLGKARAEQAEALADYQQNVLEALREVEDALADLRALRAEYDAQQLAVKASEKSVDLSAKRFKEGLVSSIESVDAIRAQLDAERRAVQIRGLQYDATVRLIQALGGGWSD